jgi:hypothetical protein
LIGPLAQEDAAQLEDAAKSTGQLKRKSVETSIEATIQALRNTLEMSANGTRGPEGASSIARATRKRRKAREGNKKTDDNDG